MSAVGRLGRFGLSSYFTLLVAVPVRAAGRARDLRLQRQLPSRRCRWAGFTTKWFHDGLLQHRPHRRRFERSAVIAILDGLAATPLGTMAAVALAGRRLFLRPVCDHADPAAAGRALHRARDRHGDPAARSSATSVAERRAGRPHRDLAALLAAGDPAAAAHAGRLDRRGRPRPGREPPARPSCWSRCRCWRRRWLSSVIIAFTISLRRVRDRLVHRASRLPHLPGVPVLGDPHAVARAAGDRDRRDRGGAVDGAGALGRDRPAVGRPAAGVGVESPRWLT